MVGMRWREGEGGEEEGRVVVKKGDVEGSGGR
jgi:hypothetical protein